ncbi:phage holin family protein, partial [Streptomyces sp. PU-14G]|uniref:phage holin family protein n=1 Tax=Streptomyces sp. PU-14G TaxID=2800808 RepID=UPI0034DF28EF
MSAKATLPRSGDFPGPASPGDLSEPVAHLIREQMESVENDLRAEVRARLGNRALKLKAGAGVLALYAGAALAVAIGLLLASVMPGWAAALVVTALLAACALALRNAARGTPRDRTGAAAPGAVSAGPDRGAATAAPGASAPGAAPPPPPHGAASATSGAGAAAEEPPRSEGAGSRVRETTDADAPAARRQGSRPAATSTAPQGDAAGLPPASGTRT